MFCEQLYDMWTLVLCVCCLCYLHCVVWDVGCFMICGLFYDMWIVLCYVDCV